MKKWKKVAVHVLTQCMYIHVYMFMCAHVHVITYVYVYMYMYMCVHVHVITYVHVYTSWKQS